MYLCSVNQKQTSKYFCTKPNHVLCTHDSGSVRARYKEIKSFKRDPSYNVLRKKESSFQKLLEEILFLNHNTIKVDGKKNYYTDLSDEKIIIEIKNVDQFRSSVGQLFCYQVADGSIKSDRKRVIVLFGELPSISEVLIFTNVCIELKIDLIWVELEELLELYRENQLQLQQRQQLQQQQNCKENLIIQQKINHVVPITKASLSAPSALNSNNENKSKNNIKTIERLNLHVNSDVNSDLYGIQSRFGFIDLKRLPESGS